MKEKLTVIKVGGKIVEEEATLNQLLNDFAAIEGHKVLVHGGGRSATKIATQLGIESKMVNGRRITDAETLKVVTMVYGGLVNKNIVAGLQALGINALGLTGAEKNLRRTDKRPVRMEYLDDIDLPEFSRLPTFKRICICILKNDHACKYMGFSPTKEEMSKRSQVMEQYRIIVS